MNSVDKVVVIGLDCGEPSLAFDRWLDDLPTLKALLKTARYGRLESCMPPITVPAWACMTTSQDPGRLGVYGFRNRADYSYDGLAIATNRAVKETRIWEWLASRGKNCIMLGVPQTYPIRPVQGCCTVASFLAPGTDSPYTYPPELKDEIADLVGEYLIDVRGFRTDDKQWLLDQIHTMTEQRFKIARHLLKTRPWDLFWMVEMGYDRIHHGFWQFMDSDHHRYEADNPFENAIHDYYVLADKLMGELLNDLDLDRTAVLIVSDHGAKRMDGGICFNDWLIREGYLTLEGDVSGPTRFADVEIDWSRTTAWGEGGYYGRCFLNVEGREPNGVIPADGYEAVRDELIEKLESMVDHEGRPLGTRAYKPQDIYRQVNGTPPDLIVIFGDLHWRSVGTVGNPDVYTFENDTGPDDANHAQDGMFVVSHPSIADSQRMDASLYDVSPSIMNIMNVAIPAGLRGGPTLSP